MSNFVFDVNYDILKKTIIMKYKRQEEKYLSQTILSSQLIDEEELLYIKNLYCEFVPYHNFIHALKVAEGVLKLPMKHFSIIEIKSLFIAALFHDAGHRGTASDLDEFRSLDMAFEGILDFEKRYDYEGIDFTIVRKAIVGTVFKNRAKNTDSYAMLLADIDVGTLGMSFVEYMFYADFPMMYELWFESLDDWLKEVGYFKYLLSVDKEIYRTIHGKKLFPLALKNMKIYLSSESREDIEHMYQAWLKSDSYDNYINLLEKNIEKLDTYR